MPFTDLLNLSDPGDVVKALVIALVLLASWQLGAALGRRAR